MSIIGNRFGHLIVLEVAGEDLERNTILLCKCDCARTVLIPQEKLMMGDVTSCGCQKKVDMRGKSNKTHGLKTKNRTPLDTRLYNAAMVMRQDSKDHGIPICNEWSESNGISNFINWALTNGYDDAHQHLCRRNFHCGFSPENSIWCKTPQWRNAIRLGITDADNPSIKYVFTIKEWSLITGLSKTSIIARLSTFQENGRSVRDILTLPLKRRNRILKFDVENFMEYNHPELWDECIHD